MTEQELLEKIKVMTNYTSEFHNDFLLGWITEAKNILANSGVSDDAINSAYSVGVIAQIITDIVDNGGVSEMTSNRISQLALTYPRKEV